MRTYCTKPLRFDDVSKKPPVWRMYPACDDTLVHGAATFGFAVRRLRDGEDPYRCPAEWSQNRLVCESFHGLPHGSPPPVPAFADVVRAQGAASGGRVTMSIVTHDYAPLGYAFFAFLAQQGIHNVVLVAMDMPAFVYLSNRGVPVVLKESIAPLEPCCLHRWRMLSWRATNDVKIRSILASIDAGVSVVMMDMDVKYTSPPPESMWEQFSDTELMSVKSYSFMWSYSKATPAVRALWQRVLDNVLDGGWDQTQYGYWAQQPEFAGIKQSGFPFAHLLSRAQNKEDSILNSIARRTGATHPDLAGIKRLVVWEGGSVCNKQGMSVPWETRRDCAIAVVLAGLRLNRTAVVHLFDLYDSHVLSSWFPVVSTGSAVSNGLAEETELAATYNTPAERRISATTITQALGSGGIGGVAPSRRGHAGDDTDDMLHLRAVMAEHKLVYLGGDPTKAARLLKTTADKHELKLIKYFVLPQSPPRASLPCMRRGGPVSESNPNPVCRGK